MPEGGADVTTVTPKLWTRANVQRNDPFRRPCSPAAHLKEANWNQVRRWNKQAPDSMFAGRKGFWPVFCASLADVFDNEVHGLARGRLAVDPRMPESHLPSAHEAHWQRTENVTARLGQGIPERLAGCDHRQSGRGRPGHSEIAIDSSSQTVP